MRLDAALMSPDLEWLTTPAAKLAWLHARIASDSCHHGGDVAVPLDAAVVSQCPGTFPIGIDSRGHLVVLYLATIPWTDDFRLFLIGHTDVLRVTADWTVRLVFPPALKRAVPAYQAVVHEEFESPLSAENVSELQHYFFHRRRGTDFNALPEALGGKLSRYAKAFSGPRFTHLYRRWLTVGEAVLSPGSATIPDALTAGRGRVEYIVLSHSYDHLLPLVDQRRSKHSRPRMRKLEGGHAFAHRQPAP
jgi:hypothetical protein